jgi:hypothetical protein
MASVTGSRRRPAPWARATPLEQLARGNKTPFSTARAAVNCISRLRATVTSRRLPPLTPNLAHSAAEEAGLQQGDHFFALKPGQNIRVIEFMILESPVFPADFIADPPYDVRSCAVSVAGIHALPALAAMPAVRTPVTVVGGDGSEILVPTTAAMPLILYGPLALPYSSSMPAPSLLSFAMRIRRALRSPAVALRLIGPRASLLFCSRQSALCVDVH